MPNEADCRQQCRDDFPNDPVKREECIEGCKSAPPEQRVLACVDGKCKERKPSKVTQEQIKMCVGKAKGEACAGESELEKCKRECREAYGPGGNNPSEEDLRRCLEECRGGSPDPGDLVLACRDGTCKSTLKNKATQAQISACVGKNAGDACEGDDDGDGDCPKGNYFKAASADECPEGYVFISRPGGESRCECSAWCLTVGYEADCRTKKGGDGDGEQWAPSDDLQAIIQSLLARIEELLGYDTGLSEEELQMIINRMTGNIKASERGRVESMEDRMAGMGLLGTGMELEEYGKIGRQTREVTADVEGQVAIDQALRKYEEFMGTTGMAQSLFGTALSAEQLEEMLNAARRGEGRQDMGLMLQYLQMLMGGNQQNPYWQAIMNQFGQQGGSGGAGNDWMYWLPFLLGGGA